MTFDIEGVVDGAVPDWYLARIIDQLGRAPPFPDTGPDAVIGTVPMEIAEARAIKETGMVAFVVSPQWPYYAEGTKHWQPNLNTRLDVINPIQVVVGDIQCGLLLSADKRVVAAFATK